MSDTDYNERENVLIEDIFNDLTEDDYYRSSNIIDDSENDIEDVEYDINYDDETSINIIDDEATYNVLMEIERLVLKNNGVIYGTYVTAKILHNYNTSKFYDINDDVEKYWDTSYSIDTNDRFMKIKKVNINFVKVNEYLKFVREIGEIYQNMYIRVFNCSYFYDFPKIKLNIIIEPQEHIHTNIEFICDGFIIKNINGKKTITYSTNTKTPYDYIKGSLKKTVEENIIKDIYQKKTICICENLDKHSLLSIIMEKISYGWKIINLPYSVISSTDDIITTPELMKFKLTNCNICLEELFNNSKKTEISILYKDIFEPSSSFYPIHHDCLLNYFKFQIDETEFTCPYRYVIDYNECKNLADFNYYKLSFNN